MSKFYVFAVLFCYLVKPICSIVQLRSFSYSFPDSPARFSSHNTTPTKIEFDQFFTSFFLKKKNPFPKTNYSFHCIAAEGLNGSSLCGILRLADPLDACSSLLNEVESRAADSATIALIVRGKCAFDEKIRNAQEAGFHAAIVYDDHQNRNLISMMGDPEGIRIYAVFVSNIAGEFLKEYAQAVGGECCILSFLNENGWTVLVISIISVLAIISLTAAIYFMHSRRRNHQETRPTVIDDKVVDILPCVTFGSVNVISHMGETCAICLEDYKYGESLSVLPCQHDFHASCVKSWLTKWSTFCPVCKHEMRV